MANTTLKLTFPSDLIEVLDRVATDREWTRSQTLRNFLITGLAETETITPAEAQDLRGGVRRPAKAVD